MGMTRSVFLKYVGELSASNQNQALNALVFVYKKRLKIPRHKFDFKHARFGKNLQLFTESCEIGYQRVEYKQMRFL